jgi:hypothetical protein
MNRYIQVRRLRGPAYILLTGILFLLADWHVLSFSRSWPLYLILAGVLMLAERAALATMDPMDFPGYPQQGPTPVSITPSPAQNTATIPPIPENHSGESGH